MPLIHKRFVKGLHSKWLMQDLGQIVALSAIAAAVLSIAVTWPHERFTILGMVVLTSTMLLLVSGFASSCIRSALRTHLA